MNLLQGVIEDRDDRRRHNYFIIIQLKAFLFFRFKSIFLEMRII